jgi:hypothetical protein
MQTNTQGHNALCYQSMEHNEIIQQQLQQQQQQLQQQQQFIRKPPSRKSFNSSQNLMYSSLSKTNMMYPTQTQSPLPPQPQQQQFQFFTRGDNNAFGTQMLNTTQNTYHEFMFGNNNNNNNNNNNIVPNIPQKNMFNRTFVKPRSTNSDKYVIGSLLNKDNYFNNNNTNTINVNHTHNNTLQMYHPPQNTYLTPFNMQQQLPPNQLQIPTSTPPPPPPLTELQIDAILSQFQPQQQQQQQQLTLSPQTQLQGHQPQSKLQYIQISTLIEKTNPSLFLKLIRTAKAVAISRSHYHLTHHHKLKLKCY